MTTYDMVQKLKDVLGYVDNVISEEDQEEMSQMLQEVIEELGKL